MIKYNFFFNYKNSLRDYNALSEIKIQALICSLQNKTTIFIDIIKTLRLIETLKNLLLKKYKKGERFLFAGSETISKILKLYIPIVKCFYIDKNWTGGILTNFLTIYKQLIKLKEFDLKKFSNLTKKEQKIVKKKEIELKKAFWGLKEMKKLPSIVLLLTDEKKSIIIDECFKLGIIPIVLLNLDEPVNICPYFIYGDKYSEIYIDFLFKAILSINI
jgi:small subunit ribosomal protein S2